MKSIFYRSYGLYTASYIEQICDGYVCNIFSNSLLPCLWVSHDIMHMYLCCDVNHILKFRSDGTVTILTFQFQWQTVHPHCFREHLAFQTAAASMRFFWPLKLLYSASEMQTKLALKSTQKWTDNRVEIQS